MTERNFQPFAGARACLEEARRAPLTGTSGFRKVPGPRRGFPFSETDGGWSNKPTKISHGINQGDARCGRIASQKFAWQRPKGTKTTENAGSQQTQKRHGKECGRAGAQQHEGCSSRESRDCNVVSPLQGAVGAARNKDHRCEAYQTGNHYQQRDRAIGIEAGEGSHQLRRPRIQRIDGDRYPKINQDENPNTAARQGLEH